MSNVIPGTLVYAVSYAVKGEPQRRFATVVVGGREGEPHRTTFGDIPTILSVSLWGAQDPERIRIHGLTLDIDRSDLTDDDDREGTYTCGMCDEAFPPGVTGHTDDNPCIG